ncbi:CLUMA_CG019855, isoform A [Clunio marinus]|uniref:CLUMA_CG019855, isoform A n=1 Tax=Clunio marinus TaxID=568069 RepID=A0A1J1J242_9DIPT|nr:CLUMA_CG019855, isoform A [Clunio marinus]
MIKAHKIDVIYHDFHLLLCSNALCFALCHIMQWFMQASEQQHETNYLAGHGISLIVYFVMSCLCLLQKGINRGDVERLVCISECYAYAILP